eukprot:1180027-Prorocentrum_minimum.AAC.2
MIRLDRCLVDIRDARATGQVSVCHSLWPCDWTGVLVDIRRAHATGQVCLVDIRRAHAVVRAAVPGAATGQVSV